ncbi:prolyl oligopeptidase family protein [Vitiosangium sp. GDMCC 1.1324]|uniref:prolyl oligopeptidase family serine peptidase n=1 Tax=Vitiosangium sp. (strain GDMCC 1.1324) TaxID=2138576 RepID=UPI000D3AD530|nr:prolyl oligopeptidase family serine peptidase [Vitiosangium sp. GDMCC 1.1324]PTL83505.1 S9 family peptidase [Vitiosangium sp. GDMCC 1.1324]
MLPLTSLAGAKSAVPPPPVAAKKAVVDTYHGTKVDDPYQWLEKSDDPEVRKWVDGEVAHMRAVLDKLPSRDAIRARLTTLMTHKSPAHSGMIQKGGVFFAMKFQPPKQQAFLVVLPSLEDPSTARVLLDPVELDPSGHTTIDFFVPSPDGKKVAVSLSKDGTESGDVSIYDMATGKPLPGELVPRVNGGTAGGSLAWNGDGSGFFYTRYPRGEERPAEDRDFYQQVYFHKLGTPTDKDTYELGKDAPRIANYALRTSENGAHVLAILGNGDGGEYALYLRGPAGTWTQLSKFEDKLDSGAFGQDGALYVLSRKGAPRGKVLRIPLATPSLDKATVVIPEGKAAIEGFRPTATRLYVMEQLGGPSQLRMVGLDGKDLGVVPTPPVSSAGGVVALGGDDILLSTSSYTEPFTVHRYAAKDGALTKTTLGRTSPVDTSNVVVDRVMCTSKDGTQVPLNILHARGTKLDGNNPTLLTGYGGFNISLSPGLNVRHFAFIEQGGVVAIANLRGGSEFGEEWHANGSLTKKQNVFDDFYACAKLLVDKKWTKPERLAIQGGSNGGLLMGAALTQHPEMYRTVIAQVGLYDMLRSERTNNGQFNVTEYGTVKDPEQFKALQAYSPYHNVKNGTKYPSVLFTSGDNDPRVDPFHSRKMVARLQEATSSKRPVLLRTNNMGHGMGTPLAQIIEESVDLYAFLFNELGVKYRPVDGKVAAPAPK